MTDTNARWVLRDAVRGQRAGVVSSTLLACGHQLSEAAVPVAVGAALDRAVGTGDGSALLLWLAVVVGVFVVLASCGAIGYLLMDRARLRAGRDVRVRASARVLDPAGGAPGRPGELIGLASSDADRTAQVVTAYARTASAAAALVAGAAVLFAASPILAAAVLAGVPVVLGASRLLARPLVGRAEAEQTTLATATSAATDLVTGVRVVKGIGAERAASTAYAKASQTALRARLAAVNVEAGYLGATTALSGLLLVVVAWVSGRLALAGTITIGELVAAVGLAQFLIEPLERLTLLGPLLAGARGSANRVAALLAAPPAVHPGTMGPELVEGRLQIRHRDLTLDLASGEHLGVVIPDGALAAELLDVLARDAEPHGGCCSTASTCRPSRWTAPGPPCWSPGTTQRCSRAPWPTTSVPRIPASWSPPWSPRVRTRCATRCRTVWIPRSASAGVPCPAVNDSGSRWPAPWPPNPRCWCCTIRRPRSTPRPRTGSPAVLRATGPDAAR